MNATTTGTPSRRRDAPRGSHTHLHGRALGVARLAWLAVAALTGTVYAASVWAGLRTREGPCPPGVCLGGRVPAGVGRAFAALHLPVGFLGGYTLALNVVFALVFAAVAALIFSRRSRDLLALFVSLTLLVFGAAAFESDMLPSRLASLSAWHWPVGLLGFLGVAAFGAFLCVFPDGRFVPRWTLLAAGAWALWVLPAYILPDSPLDFNTWPAALSLGAWALFLGAFVVAQAYRYRRVSTPAQRVQTKWVVLGLAAAAAGHFGGMLLRAFQPAVPTSAGAVLGILAADTLMYVSVLLIPLAIAVAMLRHHLFDVDLVIRLTLLYSALAAILALVYESGVVIAAKLAVTLTGESGLAAEVLAAFGAGVLAGPVHRWLDRELARTFYPPKYEAERRVEVYATQVRRELHLQSVPERLAGLEAAVAGRLPRLPWLHSAPTAPHHSPRSSSGADRPGGRPLETP